MNWGYFFLFLIPFLLFLGVVWIIYTRVRARRAGLPPPSWKSYVPFTSAPSTYHDSSFPSPRRGGAMGWFKAQFAKMRNERTHRGAYEDMESGRTGYGRTEHDDVWDSRVGGDDTGRGNSGQRGYDEEHDFEFQPTLRDSPYNKTYDEHERGRSRSRDPPSTAQHGLNAHPLDNPFGDNAEASNLRDVSPRQEQANAGGNHRGTSHSPAGRKSLFREDL